MKFRKKIYLAGLASLAAILILPILASAETITINKMQSACVDAKSVIGSYVSDLAATSNRYKNLATSTSIHGFTISVQKNSIEQAASTSLQAINGYCPNPLTTTTDYTNLINKRDVSLAVLRKIVTLDGYYAKFRELANNYTSIETLASDFPSIINIYALRGEKNIIDRAVSSTERNVALLNALDTVALFSPATLNDLNPSLNDYNAKLSRNIDLISGTARLYSQALKARKNVITRAAQEGIAKSAPADYVRLLQYYNTKATSTVINLRKDIDNKIASLRGYIAKINKASELQTPTTSTLNSAIVTATNTLAAIRATTTDGLTYLAATGNAGLVGALKISEIIIPDINQALTLNDSRKKTNELASIKNLVLASYSALRLGLSTSSQASLDAIKSNFEAVDLTTLGNAGQIETDLRDILTNKSAAALASVKADLNAYNKKLAEASRKISEYRRQWWKLIDEAAARGDITLPAGLNDERKAAKAFADFDKRREAYYAQARRIIDGRKNTIENNQLAINMLLNIPEAKKTAIDINAKSTLVASALETYYTDKVSTTKNYNDLKSVVNNIKNFKITEVYIPVQKIYYRSDTYYKKYDALNSIMNDPDLGLLAQIATISTTDEITELSVSIPSMLSALSADLSGLMDDANNSINSVLVNYNATNLAAETIYVTPISVSATEIKSLSDRETYVKKSLDKIISKVRDLNSAIKRAR